MIREREREGERLEDKRDGRMKELTPCHPQARYVSAIGSSRIAL